MKRIVFLGSALAASIGCLVLAGTSYGEAPTAEAEARMVVAHAIDALPAAELNDWVSYAHQVAVMRVTAEKELPATSEEYARGEGLIGRTVTLHTERILWSAPGEPAPPTDVEVGVTGWIMHKRKTIPYTVDEAPRLEVGASYIVPLSSFEGEWSLLSASAVIQVSSGRLAPASSDDASAVGRTRGMTAGQLAVQLSHTDADPIAVKYRHLPPFERHRAVLKERGAAK